MTASPSLFPICLLRGHLQQRCPASSRLAAYFACPGRWGQANQRWQGPMITASCGPQDDIPSPTFTLVQPYQAKGGFEVWHMDLYRLETAAQVLALGVEDAFFDCCCLIEWSDKINDLLPSDQVRIDLAMGPDEGSRVAALAASPDLLHIFKQDFFA